MESTICFETHPLQKLSYFLPLYISSCSNNNNNNNHQLPPWTSSVTSYSSDLMYLRPFPQHSPIPIMLRMALPSFSLWMSCINFIYIVSWNDKCPPINLYGSDCSWRLVPSCWSISSQKPLQQRIHTLLRLYYWYTDRIAWWVRCSGITIRIYRESTHDSSPYFRSFICLRNHYFISIPFTWLWSTIAVVSQLITAIISIAISYLRIVVRSMCSYPCASVPFCRCSITIYPNIPS